MRTKNLQTQNTKHFSRKNAPLFCLSKLLAFFSRSAVQFASRILICNLQVKKKKLQQVNLQPTINHCFKFAYLQIKTFFAVQYFRLLIEYKFRLLQNSLHCCYCEQLKDSMLLRAVICIHLHSSQIALSANVYLAVKTSCQSCKQCKQQKVNQSSICGISSSEIRASIEAELRLLSLDL